MISHTEQMGTCYEHTGEHEWSRDCRGWKPLASTPESEHEWIQAKGFYWHYCQVCGVVQRADNQNPPCKGPTKMRKPETPLITEPAASKVEQPDEWMRDAAKEMNARNLARNHVLKGAHGRWDHVMPDEEIVAIIAAHAPRSQGELREAVTKMRKPETPLITEPAASKVEQPDEWMRDAAKEIDLAPSYDEIANAIDVKGLRLRRYAEIIAKHARRSQGELREAQARLEEFLLMKHKRPADPTYFDMHHEAELREAIRNAGDGK